MVRKSMPVELFWQDVPRAFAEDVLRAVLAAYKQSANQCFAEFARPEASNLIPFYRRALLEQDLRNAADRHEGVTAEAVKGESNAWFHTRLVSGQVVLTESAVSDPNEVVRPSQFREMYAAPDNRRYLFPEMEPEESSEGSLLYGILIHGRFGQDFTLPAFADIVFPLPDLTGYHPGRIQLFSEFPGIIAKQNGFPQSRPVDEPKPKLRNDGQAELGA